MLSKIWNNSTQSKDVLFVESSLSRRTKNFQLIWHAEDYGIERIIRIILAGLQFIFPGTYVRQIFGKNDPINKDLSIDIFVLFKVVYSFMCIYYELNSIIHITIQLLFLIETILYIPTLIFASDYLQRPRSYKRSVKLLFINYIEIIIAFAVLYSLFDGGFNKIMSWYDYIYFSTITINTIGYGDITPILKWTKLLVVFQSIIGMIFIVLFINIFSNKMEMKGYFSN